MPNKQMQEVLDEYAKLGPLPVELLLPETARQLPLVDRAVVAKISDHILNRAAVPVVLPVGSVMHKLINPDSNLMVRIYTPKGDGPFPVLVYFHGGGFVIGTLDTYDSSCRLLCKMANCIVVSVAYRQAPEHPFPAAVEDAYETTNWVMENVRDMAGIPDKVVIAGESSGGNLATVVCLMAKEKGSMMPIHQLLIYPVVTFNEESSTYEQYANAKPLNKAMMHWFKKHYLANEADAQNPHASPMLADVTGLPSTTIILAEIDPLRGEGELYAKKLQDSGIHVEVSTHEGVTHEFFGMAGAIPESMKAVTFAVDQLKKVWGSK